MTTQFSDPTKAKTFIKAGDAIFTVVSKVTGARFTFKVTKPKRTFAGDIRFVALLSGPENTSDYTYMGVLSEGGSFGQTQKSRVSVNAPSWKAFTWVWDHLKANKMPPQCEIWHEGRCGRCGRTLTVPESIESGIGPECAKHT